MAEMTVAMLAPAGPSPIWGEAAWQIMEHPQHADFGGVAASPCPF